MDDLKQKRLAIYDAYIKTIELKYKCKFQSWSKYSLDRLAIFDKYNISLEDIYTLIDNNISDYSFIKWFNSAYYDFGASAEKYFTTIDKQIDL